MYKQENVSLGNDNSIKQEMSIITQRQSHRYIHGRCRSICITISLSFTLYDVWLAFQNVIIYCTPCGKVRTILR